jgi:hypothetical protein
MKLTIRKVTPDDYPNIMTVWESSVRATHDFLKEEDIVFLYDFFTSPRYRIRRHIVLILSLALITSHQTYINFQKYPDLWVYKMYLWVAYLTVIYFNIYVLVPLLLLKKKYTLYGLILSVAIILMLFARYWIKQAAFSTLNIPQTCTWISLLDSVSYFAFLRYAFLECR